MAHDFKKFPELTNSQMQFYYFDSPHKQILDGFIGKVIDVHDGDTIKVMTDFRNFDFPIRMANIQAPELNEEGGIQSREHLKQMIQNQEVYIQIDRTNRVGKFGRLIGNVIFGGDSMSDMMLRDMQAIPFGSTKII